ncbi:MAG: galactose-1-phosphate uridylyltransferase, partial [Allomuricauda sp.]
MNLEEHPHRRYNILTGEWILVSPHRTKRPWQGKQEEKKSVSQRTYDKDCYLCPGNTRSNGKTNPVYTSTYVFDNDFPALLADTDCDTYQEGLLRAEAESGICRVVCFSPNHSLTLPLMSEKEIYNVVTTWISEYSKLGMHTDINYVQIFENKGELMGCSNPHPHGQIWAQRSIPDIIIKKTRQQRAFQ